MTEKIYKIFTDFCSSEEITKEFIRNFETEKYGIEITLGEDYTHVILINRAKPHLKNIPKENVIGFAYEPWDFLSIDKNFIDYAEKNIGKYFIGDIKNLKEPFVEGNAYLVYNTPIHHIPLKNNFCSIIFSQKKFAIGHNYRHKLVDAILKTNLPIDIYGKGCKFYQNVKDDRFKGEFTQWSTEPYENYNFHICIENFPSNHYFSEKIINSLIASTTPIYWGCKNIESYFPDNTIPLFFDVDKDIELIKDIFMNQDKYRKKIDIDYVLKTTNPFLNDL